MESKLVDKRRATCISRAESGMTVDVNDTVGFGDDCEAAFNRIDNLRSSISDMRNWGCVFHEEDTEHFSQLEKAMDEFERRIHQVYKFMDK